MALTVLAGCVNGTDTRSRAGGAPGPDIFSVDGLPLTSGPVGTRPGAPEVRPVTGGDPNDPNDMVAAAALDDLALFWGARYGELPVGRDGHGTGRVDGVDRAAFAPVPVAVSWDARARDNEVARVCNERTRGFVNAVYCDDGTIGWDRGRLIPQIVDQYGPLAPVAVVAHEYGHYLTKRAGLMPAGDADNGLIAEQIADCMSGAYIRHVATDASPYFTLNTTDGLASMMATVIGVRDADTNRANVVHGSAYQRIRAFRHGFVDGAAACGGIDREWIGPSTLLQANRSFERSVSDQLGARRATEVLQGVLDRHFALPDPPRLSVDPAPCTTPSDNPAVYCPDQNVVAIDTDRLDDVYVRRAGGAQDLNGRPLVGDFSSISLIVSRYALAVLAAEGVDITSARAGLGAACLAGEWTGTIGRVRGPLSLDTGDVDEAITAALDDGWMAEGTGGGMARGAFVRVQAFADGIDRGREPCLAYVSG